MILTKQQVLAVLETMPETFSAEEFISEVIINAKVQIARQQINNGDFLTDAEVDKEIQKWAKNN